MESSEYKKRRTIRVDDALWSAYAEACAAYNKKRSADLVQHMQAKVYDYEQRKARELANSEGDQQA